MGHEVVWKAGASHQKSEDPPSLVSVLVVVLAYTSFVFLISPPSLLLLVPLLLPHRLLTFLFGPQVMQFRFGVGMIDTIIAKYMATVVGYHIVSRPLLNMSNPKHVNSTQNELQEEYYRSGRMMLQMAQVCMLVYDELGVREGEER